MMQVQRDGEACGFIQLTLLPLGIEPRAVRKFIIWVLKPFTEGLSASGSKQG